jgi:hypothetical protein
MNNKEEEWTLDYIKTKIFSVKKELELDDKEFYRFLKKLTNNNTTKSHFEYLLEIGREETMELLENILLEY